MQYAIVEDEPLARKRLKRLIRSIRPAALCLAEAADGQDGLDMLSRLSHELDVVFMDVEFPPEGAFDLLKNAQKVGINLPPLIFCTAFDRFAVQAFRWAACDYLLKPIEIEQLEESLCRLDSATQQNMGNSEHTVNALLKHLNNNQNKSTRFTVQHRGRMLVMHWQEVSHIQTENRLVFVHIGDKQYVIEHTMLDLEKMLHFSFFRCHRSALVRVDCIREVCANRTGTGQIILTNGQIIPVSRDKMSPLRQLLGA